ncbi:unnamed protein product [Echinostoma caproni]|uniref:JmjC domain-containing protein n=1 Tax=Echinostoma caproni TaxID=27848 RepID=A0A183ASY4_9TREM|nr:unnamed protein product [Echinostoma caproni]
MRLTRQTPKNKTLDKSILTNSIAKWTSYLRFGEAVQRARATMLYHTNSIAYLPNPNSMNETQWRWSGLHPRPIQPREMHAMPYERWIRPITPGFDLTPFPTTAFAAAARLAAATAFTNASRIPGVSGSNRDGVPIVGSHYFCSTPRPAPETTNTSGPYRTQAPNSFQRPLSAYHPHNQSPSIQTFNHTGRSDEKLAEEPGCYQRWPSWTAANVAGSHTVHTHRSMVPEVGWNPHDTANLDYRNNNIQTKSEHRETPPLVLNSHDPNPSISGASLRPDSSCAPIGSDAPQIRRDCFQLSRQWLIDTCEPGYVVSSSDARKTRCTIWASRLLAQTTAIIHRVRLDRNTFCPSQRQSTDEEDDDESENELLDEDVWLNRMRNPTGIAGVENRPITGSGVNSIQQQPDTTQLTSVNLTESERNDILTQTMPKLIGLVTIQVMTTDAHSFTPTHPAVQHARVAALDHLIMGTRSTEHIVNSVLQEWNQLWHGRNTIASANQDRDGPWGSNVHQSMMLNIKPESGSTGTASNNWLRNPGNRILHKLVSILRTLTPDPFEWNCLKALILFDERMRIWLLLYLNSRCELCSANLICGSGSGFETNKSRGIIAMNLYQVL